MQILATYAIEAVMGLIFEINQAAKRIRGILAAGSDRLQQLFGFVMVITPGATAERFTASCVGCGNPREHGESSSRAREVGFGLIFDEAGSLEKLLGS